MDDETAKGYAKDVADFIDNGAITIRLGGADVRVEALKVRGSVRWTRSVTEAFTEAQLLVKKLSTATEADEIKGLMAQAFETSSADKAADLLIAHGIDAATVDNATAAEVIEALARVYQLENPRMRLTGSAIPQPK